MFHRKEHMRIMLPRSNFLSKRLEQEWEALKTARNGPCTSLALPFGILILRPIDLLVVKGLFKGN